MADAIVAMMPSVHPGILFSVAVVVVAICRYLVSGMGDKTPVAAQNPHVEGGGGDDEPRRHIPKRHELAMWQRHEALIRSGADTTRQPLDDDKAVWTRRGKDWASMDSKLDESQKRIRKIMTGSSQSPLRQRAPRAEVTIQEECDASRTSSSDAPLDHHAQRPKVPLSPLSTVPPTTRVPAFIKRTGSGVRSDQGAVDTPITSPLCSPRGGRRPENLDELKMLSSPVIPFSRTGSAGSKSPFLARAGSSALALEAMEEDDAEFANAASGQQGIMRTASGDAAQQGIMRTASGGIAPYSPGTFDLDALEDLLDKEDGEIGVEKDDLREERPGRSQRPKTLYWQKKTYGPGNWINRGTESPTRDLSPMRGGYDLIERSVSPVRPPRGW